VELVRRERERLQATLAELGVEYYPSQANFVTFQPRDPVRIHDALRAGGLAVRDGADLGLTGWLRVSIGAPPEMALLRRILREVL
jgi:histidinol-phosphate aminotransferase